MWEYCVDTFHGSNPYYPGLEEGDRSELQKLLNKYAKEGWELDKIVPQSGRGTTRTHVLIFKKQRD